MCLPWAAASCWPALVFSRMLSRSYSASEAKMEHELARRRGGADAQGLEVDAALVKQVDQVNHVVAAAALHELTAFVEVRRQQLL